MTTASAYGRTVQILPHGVLITGDTDRVDRRREAVLRAARAMVRDVVAALFLHNGRAVDVAIGYMENLMAREKCGEWDQPVSPSPIDENYPDA